MTNDLTLRTKDYISKHHLLKFGDSVLVAVSGGADSVCLLHLLLSLRDELKIKITVAHVNHMLRGDESFRDESFVRKLCDSYDVPLHVLRINIASVAEEKHCSIEEAGRFVRYDYFHKIASQNKLTCIATAHNKNDNVETLCMRILRGTSIHGLIGIPPKNDLGVIRPLLHAERAEIEEYLHRHGIDYVTDSTNAENNYTRNKIRNCVLPYIISEFNENFIHTIGNCIEGFRETDSFLEKHTKKAYDDFIYEEEYGVCVNIKNILSLDRVIAKRLIQACIKKTSDTNATSDLVSKIFDMCVHNTNGSICVNKQLEVHSLYGKLHFVNRSFFQDYKFTLHISQVEKPDLKDQNAMYVPASLSKESFSIRPREKGDKMFLEKCGHKKVKDILIDAKIPFFLRDTIPVVLYEEEIIWLCGIRSNAIFRANAGEPCIKLTYKKEKNHA